MQKDTGDIGMGKASLFFSSLPTVRIIPETSGILAILALFQEVWFQEKKKHMKVRKPLEFQE